MNWVKNNLQLVFGGCAILVLIGASGWFLLAQMEKEKDVQAQLEREINNLDRLKNHNPHPSMDNIAKVKQEQEKIQSELLHPLQEAFKPFSLPENLDASAFKIFLEKGIASMYRAAQNAGTQLPRERNDSEYSFSFSDIRTKLSLESETLQPLAFQLVQLESLCQILFDAKIHSIKKIKRPEVKVEGESAEETDDDYGNDYPEEQKQQNDPYHDMMMMNYAAQMAGYQSNNSSESFATGLSPNHYIEETPMTNEITGTILYPFRLRFQCFSRELSDVLSGLNNSDHFFRVKWMAVEQKGRGSSLDGNYSYYASEAGGKYNPYDTAYGSPQAMGGYGGSHQNVSTAGLEEKPLTVNMLVEAISFPPLMDKSEKSEADSVTDNVSAYKSSGSAGP